MKYRQNDVINAGRKKLSESVITICGIVRNCDNNLKKNITTINMLCDAAKDYHIIIFENDSVDNTKQVLQEWQKQRKNIHISLADFHTTTIPEQSKIVNRYFSRHRIEKMATYRNYYLEYISNNQIVSNYILVLDMDVKKVPLNGIFHSLGENREWDCITANGYIYSPSVWFKKRYNDAYALVECGMENTAQTEKIIKQNQYRWAFLKPDMPFIRVYSAFGGLAIYKYAAIKDCRYSVIQNQDEHVEVRCEHFSLYKQMMNKGFDKVYINPYMAIRYQPYIFQHIKKLLQNNQIMQSIRNLAGTLYSRVKLLIHWFKNTN
jgi:glycosyltransferase involved in cell wall biosynthesis